MNGSKVAKTTCATRPSSNVTMINVFQRNTHVITRMIVEMDLTNLHKYAHESAQVCKATYDATTCKEKEFKCKSNGACIRSDRICNSYRNQCSNGNIRFAQLPWYIQARSNLKSRFL